MDLKPYFKIMYKAHTGQKDKEGKDYIFHPLTVAGLCKTDMETAVALLHDVLEDTDYTEQQLLDEGAEQSVIDLVKVLTRQSTETYSEYIDRICDSENISVIHVKEADLKHNIIKCKLYKDKYKSLLKRYEPALEKIQRKLQSM